MRGGTFGVLGRGYGASSAMVLAEVVNVRLGGRAQELPDGHLHEPHYRLDCRAGGGITCQVTGGLTSKGKYTCRGTVTYDAAGTYNVWAQADSLNSVNETHENNNVKRPVSLTAQ